MAKDPTSKKPSLSPGEEDKLAHDQWERYTRARDNGHIDYVDLAKKCDAYYQGEQWDAKMSPCWILKVALPRRSLSFADGKHVPREQSNRADIKFKPAEEVRNRLRIR